MRIKNIKKKKCNVIIRYSKFISNIKIKYIGGV